jgi:protein-S-isoprenylcysteine O-methyltransferase Ste14
MMEPFPALSLGWLNGWIALALLVLVDGILFLTYPKPALARVWNRSGWSRKQAVFTVVGKLFALIFLVLIALTPLKIGAPVFYLGSVLAALGLAGLAKALIDFRDTPLGEPVDRGVYRISRHPQIVMSSAVLLGACIAVGSWTALIVFAAARFFSHWGLVAEEEICLKQYGNAYREYLQRVPRYFLFF